ncbi:hypothetical protein B1207_00305 [Legionella quinlivanii]|uniref:Uncharacterized protein n=1 Tax=Legionella quinlivanii TaxID=45073 RepID=A0A364LN11_9GAMM|nr:hypothetical protein [Legionella quinlivanii]RAP38368.1 hypothetical protein B1207_00305 [Legionella quinlivanii]
MTAYLNNLLNKRSCQNSTHPAIVSLKEICKDSQKLTLADYQKIITQFIKSPATDTDSVNIEKFIFSAYELECYHRQLQAQCKPSVESAKKTSPTLFAREITSISPHRLQILNLLIKLNILDDKLFEAVSSYPRAQIQNLYAQFKSIKNQDDFWSIHNEWSAENKSEEVAAKNSTSTVIPPN